MRIPKLYERDVRSRQSGRLTRETETDLARRALAGDVRARHRLVEGNLLLVVKMASDFARRGKLNVADLIQEGNVGLLEALNHFDPDNGARFGTYARPWIHSRLVAHAFHQGPPLLSIKTPVHGIGRAREAVWRRGVAVTGESVAAELGLPVDTVEPVMTAWKSYVPLQKPVYSGDGDSGTTVADLLPDEGPGPEDIVGRSRERRRLRAVIRAMPLSKRERQIANLRFLAEDPAAPKAIASEWDVTRQSIEQAEKRLLVKIGAAYEPRRRAA